MQSVTIHLANEQQTLDFGKKLASNSGALQVIFLHGNLGAGKTTLTRGILQGLGFEGAVKSPTYALVETYVLGNRTIHHFDLYRLHGSEDLEELGFRDYFTPDNLCLIEWPERVKHLPRADLICNLEIIGNARNLVLFADTKQGEQVIQEVVPWQGF